MYYLLSSRPRKNADFFLKKSYTTNLRYCMSTKNKLICGGVYSIIEFISDQLFWVSL